MIDRDDLFRRFANANPIPNEEGLPNWLSDSRPPLTLLIRESRLTESGTHIVEYPPPRDALLFDEGSDMKTMERKEVIETRRPLRWGVAVAAVAAVIVLVGGVIGIGILTSGDDEVAAPPTTLAATTTTAAPTPHEIATARVESFFAAWGVYDGGAVAALFTEDGVYEDPSPSGVYVGRDAIAGMVESVDGRRVSDGQVTGELVPTGDGAFAFSFEFAVSGEPWIGEAVVTIDGDLISRLEVLRMEPKDLASATELADSFFAAWSVYDGEAVGALFTEDGVYEDPSPSGVYVGRDAIARMVEGPDGRTVSDGQVAGELVPTDDGAFAFSFEFAVSGEPRVAGAVVTIDGDLISRFEVVSWEVKE